MAAVGSRKSPGAQTPDSLLRQSLPYQYHNAPEVAPTQGLEFDDNSFSHSSDKYPVVHELRRGGGPPDYTGYDGTIAPKAPLILFGMKPKTFILVAVVMVCIIVGASVGGAVGGRNMHGGITSTTDGIAAATTVVEGTASSTTATTVATTPTYVPLSDCPSSNETTYSSSSFANNQTFTKHCDVTSPLSDGALSVVNITQAFVYSFDDCIEICASYNSFGSSATNCSIAVYEPSSSRPADCWVASTSANGTITLSTATKDGVAVAVLE